MWLGVLLAIAFPSLAGEVEFRDPKIVVNGTTYQVAACATKEEKLCGDTAAAAYCRERGLGPMSTFQVGYRPAGMPPIHTEPSLRIVDGTPATPNGPNGEIVHLVRVVCADKPGREPASEPPPIEERRLD